MEGLARATGYRGEHWVVDQSATYYSGGKEQAATDETDDDGHVIMGERSCMGLGTRPHMQLEGYAPTEFASEHEVAQRVATGDALRWPAQRPHLHVRRGGVMDRSGSLWSGGCEEIKLFCV